MATWLHVHNVDLTPHWQSFREILARTSYPSLVSVHHLHISVCGYCNNVGAASVSHFLRTVFLSFTAANATSLLLSLAAPFRLSRDLLLGNSEGKATFLSRDIDLFT